MSVLPDHQCRRCGQEHDDMWQLVDPESRWAVTFAHCSCGHKWAVIHTDPMSLPAIRAWVAAGSASAAVPEVSARQLPWKRLRLEGITPAVSAAS